MLKERQKAGAIYWRAIGKTEKQIREITGLSVTTIIRHITKYNELGSEYISENNYKDNTTDIEREEVRSAYGRQRFNVMGLLDSVTHQTITVTNDTYITSTEIVNLLEKTREMNKGKKVCIVLDNARYQKCELVAAAAKKNKITIIYLPTYSPNLNLMERLWKYLRSVCLANKYSMTFNLFCDSILDCLSKTANPEVKNKLDSLLAHNFETIGI